MDKQSALNTYELIMGFYMRTIDGLIDEMKNKEMNLVQPTKEETAQAQMVINLYLGVIEVLRGLQVAALTIPDAEQLGAPRFEVEFFETRYDLKADQGLPKAEGLPIAND